MMEELTTYGPILLGIAILVIDGTIAYLKNDSDSEMDDYIPVLRHLKRFLEKMRGKK